MSDVHEGNGDVGGRSQQDSEVGLTLAGLEYSSDAVFDSVYVGLCPDCHAPTALCCRHRHRLVSSQAREVGLEYVSHFMPKSFIDLYERLLLEQFSDSAMSVHSGQNIDIPGVGKGSGGMAAVKSETTEVRSVHRQPVGGDSATVIRSEAAMHFRSGVDRKIRKISREIKFYLDSKGGRVKATKPQRKCDGNCKKFGDGDWNWCPYCGGPMRELDR